MQRLAGRPARPCDRATAAIRAGPSILHSPLSTLVNSAILDAASKAFPTNVPGITLGALVHEGEVNPSPSIRIPLPMMNRHGLIAGATGTGKTKSLQLIAEQLSNAGVSVFLADIKGDVSGVGAAGEPSDRVAKRAKDTGYEWRAASFPVEFLSLTGARGAQLRATVSSFGPLLLARVLDLNETQIERAVAGL